MRRNPLLDNVDSLLLFELLSPLADGSSIDLTTNTLRGARRVLSCGVGDDVFTVACLGSRAAVVRVDREGGRIGGITERSVKCVFPFSTVADSVFVRLDGTFVTL